MTVTGRGKDTRIMTDYDESVEHPQPEEGQWDDQVVYGPSTVIAALEHISSIVSEARAVPLSAMVMVNQAEILDLLEQACDALPDNLAAADTIVADADALLVRADSAAEVTIAEANNRARSTIDEAREKAQHLVTDAQERAEHMTTTAKEEAERIRRDAEREAETVVADAQREAERLASQENISAMAEDRARHILAEAREQDAQLRRGADEYAAKSLGELSTLLAELQRRTDSGKRAIDERSGINRTEFNLDD